MALARGQVTCLQLNQGGSAFVGIKDDTNLVTGFIISNVPMYGYHCCKLD
jgi:hypothetical protein